MIKVTQQYEHLIANQQLQFHPAQRQLASQLDELAAILEKPRWLRISEYRGLYIHGGVGIGKSMLVKMFYHSLQTHQKLHMHFYSFMHQIHDSLQQLQGTKNPLKHIAKEFSQKTRLICLDEFLVEDIVDAMMLKELFSYLIQRKIYLVITSNCAPQDIYSNGLQRARFIPAIELIENKLQVIEMPDMQDYRRLIVGENKQSYAGDRVPGIVRIARRDIACLHLNEDTKEIHFTFASICQSARNSKDYYAIAARFDKIVVNEVPIFTESDEYARRFISLVDVLYDCSCKLVLMNSPEPDTMYQSGILAKDFERIASRIIEINTQVR